MKSNFGFPQIAQNLLIGFSFVTRVSELAIHTTVLEEMNKTMKIGRKVGLHPKLRASQILRHDSR